MSLSSMRKRNTNNKQDTVKPQPVSESKELQFSSRRSRLRSLFGLFVVLCLAIPLAYLSDDWLPTPLPASILPSQFSEERALTHLHAITTFGVRTVGSNANENLTPNYILNFVDSVRAHAPDGVDIEAETQRPSGSFTSWFLGGFTNVYDQVTNVVVRVSFTGARHRQNALLKCVVSICTFRYGTGHGGRIRRCCQHCSHDGMFAQHSTRRSVAPCCYFYF